jgi:hypothetical protein
MAVAQILQVFNQKELTGCRYLRVSLRRAIRMNASIPSCRFGVLFYLATIAGVYGQVAVSPPTTTQVLQNQATLQAYQQEQQTLAQEWQALVASGATQQQLQAWQQQNAAQFAAQQQRAQAMASALALQPMPVNVQPTIPANASQTLKDFLTTQAALANARAQIHNQLVQSMPSTPSAAQISQIQQQEMQMFQQQNAVDLQLQVQRAQTLANESAQTPLPVPGPTVVPTNATPEFAAYLKQRNELALEWVQLWNQYVNADPAVRAAAMQQWQQQNAGQIQQLQQAAQNLAQAGPITQN